MGFLEIIFIISMFLWLLTLLPIPPMNQYPVAANALAFISVVILGIEIFSGGHVGVR